MPEEAPVVLDLSALSRRELEQLVRLQWETLDGIGAASVNLVAAMEAADQAHARAAEQWAERVWKLTAALDRGKARLAGKPEKNPH